MSYGGGTLASRVPPASGRLGRIRCRACAAGRKIAVIQSLGGKPPICGQWSAREPSGAFQRASPSSPLPGLGLRTGHTQTPGCRDASSGEPRSHCNPNAHVARQSGGHYWRSVVLPDDWELTSQCNRGAAAAAPQARGGAGRASLPTRHLAKVDASDLHLGGEALGVIRNENERRATPALVLRTRNRAFVRPRRDRP